MAFKIVQSGATKGRLMRPNRAQWLSLTCQAAVWFIAGLGALNLFCWQWLAWKLRMRYGFDTFPLVKGYGVALLALALLLRKSLKDGKEPLAVDLMLLFFLGTVASFLFALRRSILVAFDWFPFAASIIFTALLLWLRNSRSLASELWEKEAVPLWRTLFNREPPVQRPAPKSQADKPARTEEIPHL